MTSMKSTLNSHRQLKLTSGEEIITEVIQFPDQQDATMVIRAAFTVLSTESRDGYRYFGFRPWMTYCEDPEHLLSLNADQVVGECYPSSGLFEQYQKTVETYAKITDEKLKEEAESDSKQSYELDEEIVNKIFNDVLSDSDGNIITLFPKEKMH